MAISAAAKKILYVEDDKGISRLVSKRLENFGYNIHLAETGKEGLKLFVKGGFDLVILDFMLPDVDGIGLLKALGAPDELPPVIMLTGLGNEKTAIEALKNGATDYLIKDVDQNFLELLPGVINTSLLKKHLEEENIKNRESLEFYARELERKNEELKQLAYHDTLTGLSNRAVFFASMKHAFLRAKRHNKAMVLFYIDLDGFKAINDLYGHDAGDEVLTVVGKRLREIFRESDSIFRLGGDEFAVILEGVAHIDDSSLLINKTIEKISEPFLIDGEEKKIGCSIGVSYYPGCGETPEEVVKNADSAMYIAKKESGNSFRFFTEEMNKKALIFAELKNDILTALLDNQFHINYQPKFNLKDNLLASAEVLIRWEHPSKGTILPSTFIPIAEKAELISDISCWILKSIFSKSVEWENLNNKKITFAVKVSGAELRRKDFEENFLKIMNEWKFPAERLVIEITENNLVNSLPRIKKVVESLRSKKIRVAVDDFGLGHFALDILKTVQADYVKIDKTLIAKIFEDKYNEALVNAIIQIGHACNLKVVAEGVEEKQQLDFLKKSGCDEAQGFLLGKPMLAEELEKLF